MATTWLFICTWMCSVYTNTISGGKQTCTKLQNIIKTTNKQKKNDWYTIATKPCVEYNKDENEEKNPSNENFVYECIYIYCVEIIIIHFFPDFQVSWYQCSMNNTLCCTWNFYTKISVFSVLASHNTIAIENPMAQRKKNCNRKVYFMGLL